MPTFEQELVTVARMVARLQTQRRRLRRQLKKVEADLRIEKKHLRALMNASEQRRPDIVPSRLFGDGVGLCAQTGTDASVVVSELPPVKEPRS